MSSFKSSENIQKTEGGPDRSVSDNQSSLVTLNELAMKAKIIGNEDQDNKICILFITRGPWSQRSSEYSTIA